MDVEKEIISIIAEVSGFDIDEVTRDSNLADDLDVDSIKAIEITVSIEKKFRISVRDEEVPQIRTVQDAINKVQQLMTGK